MKNLLFIICMFISFNSFAQNVKIVNGNYVAVKSEIKDSAKLTGQNYTDAKGEVFPVYISAKGKLFVIRTSKNGNTYKFYLKIS